MKRIVLGFFSMVAVTAHAGSGQDHWGYSGHSGPQHWGEMKKEFATCSTGTRQSPIDINFAKLIAADFGTIHFEYQPASPLILNNGHTIQVNYTEGSKINVVGKQYNLAQFHFHSPSENTVDGKPYDMEMHLVHKNDKGDLAVVGVFVKQGKHNPELEKAWSKMPNHAGDKQTMSGTQINAAKLLPKTKTFAHFKGSLTTPPCSEGVNWYVMNQPIEASAQQIAKFVNIIGNNARPTQQLNNRFVLSSK